MKKKIVKIQKLNDIDPDDWKITFEYETHINHKHEQFFELVEKGLAINNVREIRMSERPRAD